MNCILKNMSSGEYVSRPGSYNSYTAKLENAQIYSSREEAKRHRCDNEVIINVSDILTPTHSYHGSY